MVSCRRVPLCFAAYREFVGFASFDFAVPVPAIIIHIKVLLLSSKQWQQTQKTEAPLGAGWAQATACEALSRTAERQGKAAEEKTRASSPPGGDPGLKGALRILCCQHPFMLVVEYELASSHLDD
eukprot:m.121793 g.121793  ORF g.121793 m.121793 type:complete len:125 (-) comp52104_c0_seq8:235-609(-)